MVAAAVVVVSVRIYPTQIFHRYFHGVNANSTNLIQDYVTHALSVSETSRLSEDQTKQAMCKGLRGSLKDLVDVMIMCGAPLRSISKFLLSLSMEKTRMKIILDSFDEGPRSTVVQEALDEMEEIVLLLMSKNVLAGVTEPIVSKIRAEVLILALKRILPDDYVESYKDKGYSVDEIVKKMLLEDENNRVLKGILMLNSKSTASFRQTRDVESNHELVDRKFRNAGKIESGVSDMVHLHVGSALNEDGQSKQQSTAAAATTTTVKTTTRRTARSDSAYWSSEPYEDDDSYYDGWESSSESREEKESATKKSTTSKATTTTPGIVIQSRSSSKKKHHHKANIEYSGEYVDIEAYMENYRFDSDGGDDDEEDEEYDLEDDDDDDEMSSESKEIMSKERVHRSAVREIISDSTEESEKLDELYDKLVDMGRIPG